ncbi:hypothetical protein DPMN_121203 [Dreissena polymorpha]|uniref:Uncharacterized protein n=1 Tax=Dreissena polymorpha TaxID=45954 RepID=A0A9D4GL92_DREPO|nr:hypothetical protein DPMN_121203 [Dreissena polymorpha]
MFTRLFSRVRRWARVPRTSGLTIVKTASCDCIAFDSSDRGGGTSHIMSTARTNLKSCVNKARPAAQESLRSDASRYKLENTDDRHLRSASVVWSWDSHLTSFASLSLTVESSMMTGISRNPFIHFY